MRRIENDGHAVGVAQGDYILISSGISAEANKHDGARVRRDFRFDALGMKTEIFVDVCEDRFQIFVKDGVVSRNESQGRRDDFIAILPATRR